MARKRKDRTSVESAATVDTIDTVETVDSTGNIPEDIGDSISSSSNNNNNNNNIDAEKKRKSAPPQITQTKETTQAELQRHAGIGIR
jgi:hypothetical protein